MLEVLKNIILIALRLALIKEIWKNKKRFLKNNINNKASQSYFNFLIKETIIVLLK